MKQPFAGTNPAILLSAAVLLMPAVAAAQPNPVGPETLVNTFTTGAQIQPEVAATSGGGFVVIWQGASGQDGDRNGIFGQRFGAAGQALGAEFLVNTTTYLSQGGSSLASNGSGEFVVVWNSDLQDGGPVTGVFGQRFSATGQKIGGEFAVNNVVEGNQFGARIAQAADGSFVVVFVDNADLDGDGRGIFLRRFDAAGSAIGVQFQVNTYTTYSQDVPDVAVSADGAFAVVWTGPSQSARDGDGQAILGRRYNASGSALGDEFVVNSYTTSNQLNASISMADDGRSVVTWEANGVDGDSIGVFAKLFDAGGAATTGDFQVNSFTTGLQFGARAAFQPGGNVIISWVGRNQDGDSGGVISQLFDASGDRIGTEFVVNTTTAGNQSNAEIAATGSFVVTWAGNGGVGDGDGVFVQRYEVVTPSTTTTTLPTSGCGDVNGGGITATDALFLLQAAIGTRSCALCICDVDGGGSITATDALVALKVAVGQVFELKCPPC